MTIKLDQHALAVQAARPALSQTMAYTGVSSQSAVFQSGSPINVYASDGSGTVQTQPNNTTHIRVVATTNAWIAFGTNPTAAVGGATSILLPALTPEYFWVNRGERIAVIQDSGGGSLNIAELAN